MFVHSLTFSERWAVYETAVYMAWIDRRLAAAEVSAARAVAEELDLSVGGAATPGSVLTAGPPQLGDIGLERLRSWPGHVAYATAAWMALADGVEHRAEAAVLRTLRYRLGMSDVIADLLEASVLLVRVHGGRAPLRTEYRALLHAVFDVVMPSDLEREPDAETLRAS